MKKVQYLTVKQIKERLEKKKSARGLWEGHWDEVINYIFPRRGTVTGQMADGQKTSFRLLDNTGVQSNELLAGMLHSLLTNPDVFWFEFTTGDVTLDNKDAVRKWFQQVIRQLHSTLNNSNFQTEVAEMYLDLTSLGTGCQHIEESDEEIVRFMTYFVKDYYIGEDYHGRVSELDRCWKWPVSQLVAKWGKDKIPPRLFEAYMKGKDDPVEIIHTVYPSYISDPEKGDDEQWLTQYVLPEHDYEIEQGKFDSFPYVVPRWGKASGETWGRSPGMNALPEMKVLNKMNETMLIGAQKVVDPPVQLPDDGFILPFITKPGGINYYRSGTDIAKPVFNDTRIDFGFQAMEDRRQRVRDAFYVDQLKLRQGGPMMTATEVLQRTEEAMRLLGPMLGRMHQEYLKPMVERVYKIMLKRGKLPPVPQELVNVRLDVKYSSLIAKAQRMSDIQNISRTLETIAPFLQIDPRAADNFNVDNIVRIVASNLGFPQEAIRDAQEVIDKREQEAQARQQMMEQQQQEAQMNQAMTGSQTLKNLQETAR